MNSMGCFHTPKELKTVASCDDFKSKIQTHLHNREDSEKQMKNTYKSIDLFAGIGGIRLGFEKAFGDSISTVFVSEWDEYAQKTYKANFQNDFPIAGDITKIDEKEIPQFDICLAGFPCQAFSLAGKHLGFEKDYIEHGRNP